MPWRTLLNNVIVVFAIFNILLAGQKLNRNYLSVDEADLPCLNPSIVYYDLRCHGRLWTGEP